ncbi:hypothetical protein LSAT2_003858 [Lamellibrachia satsuma]|nr:hypothetical protein LSAT2_003858 [Lamellibrachia satsuma]
MSVKSFSRCACVLHRLSGNGLTSAVPLSVRHVTSEKLPKSPTVVLSADQTTVICWHPEPQFPYIHTKPLPRRRDELEEGESVLKVQYLADTTPVSKTVDGPTDQELMKMFSTTKHEWKYTPRKRCNLPEDNKGCNLPEDSKGCNLPEDSKGCNLPEDSKGCNLPEDNEGCNLPEDSKGCNLPEDNKGCNLPEDNEGCNLPEDSEGCNLPEDSDGCNLPEDSKRSIWRNKSWFWQLA